MRILEYSKRSIHCRRCQSVRPVRGVFKVENGNNDTTLLTILRRADKKHCVARSIRYIVVWPESGIVHITYVQLCGAGLQYFMISDHCSDSDLTNSGRLPRSHQWDNCTHRCGDVGRSGSGSVLFSACSLSMKGRIFEFSLVRRPHLFQRKPCGTWRFILTLSQFKVYVP